MTTERRESTAEVPWLVLAALTAVALAAEVLFGWALRSGALIFLGLLFAVGAATVGALLGFLFGIPRTVAGAPEPEQTGETRPSAIEMDEAGSTRSLEYRPSTNLEQISDWLTKILIGVGLVQAEQIGSFLHRLGSSAESAFDPRLTGAGAFTQAVVVAFSVLGFIASYLWTRVHYAGILASADLGVLKVLRSVERRLDRQEQQSREESERLAETQNLTRLLTKGELRRPEAVEQAHSAATASAAAPDEATRWPEQLREQVEQFRSRPRVYDSDPVDELFGSEPSHSNGRDLTAKIVANLEDALVIALTVRRTGGAPLAGTATFLLHPTYPDPMVAVPIENDQAVLQIYAGEWFTVAVIVDEGATVLSYSLRNLPDAPQWFIEAP